MTGEEFQFRRGGSGEAETAEYLRVCAVERVRLLALCLVALPRRERTIVLMHYVDEVPLKGIATTLGVTVQTVSRLHQRSLRALRRMLAMLDIKSRTNI